jgi:hypothetical protein
MAAGAGMTRAVGGDESSPELQAQSASAVRLRRSGRRDGGAWSKQAE